MRLSKIPRQQLEGEERVIYLKDDLYLSVDDIRTLLYPALVVILLFVSFQFGQLVTQMQVQQAAYMFGGIQNGTLRTTCIPQLSDGRLIYNCSSSSESIRTIYIPQNSTSVQ